MGLALNDLQRMVSFTEPAVHPSHSYGVVVHKVVNADKEGYTGRLYLVGPGIAPRFLTQGPNDAHPVFSPDGAFIWFIRSEKDRGQRVMRLPLDGGEPQAVGPAFWDAVRVIPIPQQSGALVMARAPHEAPKETNWPRHYERWQWQYDGQAYFPDQPLSLWRVDDTGDPVRLDLSPYGIGSVSISADGRSAVYDRVADEEGARIPRNDLFRVALESPYTQERLTEGPNTWHSPLILDDGRVVALGSGLEFGPATIESLYEILPRVRRMPLPDDLEVGEGISSDIRFGAGMLTPTPLGSEGVLVAATKAGRTHLFAVDASSATSLELEVAVVAQYASRRADTAVLYTGGNLDCLDEVYWWQNDVVTELTAENRWARGKLSSIELMHVELGADWRIPAYVIGREPGHPKPLLLYVHGGPHGAYGESPRYDSQVMAGEGYLVAQVNPRGSMGYGQAFRDAVRQDWGGEDMKDLMAVVDRLIDEGAADPEHLYVTGGSYGGFMTSWIVGHSERFRAASTVVPVTNLVSFYGTSDIGWWFGPGEVGLTPFDDIQALWNASPLAYASKVKTPTQVVAGEDDRRCPIEQAEQYYTALKHFGVPTEFLRYPGPHSFSTQGRPDLRQDRLTRLFAWFDRFR